MNRTPLTTLVFAVVLPLVAGTAFGSDNYADAIAGAKAKLSKRQFAAAATDADAAMGLATNQAQKAAALVLRGQALDQSGKADAAVAAYLTIGTNAAFDVRQRVGAYRSIAELTLRNRNWSRTRDVCADARVAFDAALALPGLTAADTFSLKVDRAATYEAVRNWKAALDETAKLLALPDLTNDQRVQVLARMACDKIELGDATRIGTEIDAIRQLPVAVGLKAVTSIAQKLASRDLAGAEQLLRDTMKLADMPDARKLDILQSIFGLRLKYATREAAKPVMEEILKAAEGKPVKVDGLLLQFAAKAVEATDFKTATEYYRKAAAIAPDNVNACLGAAGMALMSGDGAAAQADLQRVLANPKVPASQRYIARIVQLAAASPDADAFRQQIAQADQEFAAEKFPAEQRFELLREASARLFAADRHAEVRALQAETAAMMRPVPKKTFICRYVQDVPRSADSWARSPLLKDTRYRESRFDPYANLNDTFAADLANLKDAPAVSVKPGYDTAAYVVYNERGVHIYVQGDDPEARQIEQGLVKGGSLEMYFQPGRDHAYHWWYFELPGTDDPHLVNWDTPHRHYRYTYDYLTKDACTTPTGVGAYTFIPWLLVYDKLPSAANPWYLSVIRGSKGGSVTLGGKGHELGRALEMTFEMTPAQLLAIKREIIAEAFAQYQAERKRLDGVSLWKDSDLGDSAFYTSDVQPVFEALDKAGEKVAGVLTDAEVESLFTQCVPDWMEIKFKVAELRRDYLARQHLTAATP